MRRIVIVVNMSFKLVQLAVRNKAWLLRTEIPHKYVVFFVFKSSSVRYAIFFFSCRSINVLVFESIFRTVLCLTLNIEITEETKMQIKFKLNV